MIDNDVLYVIKVFLISLLAFILVFKVLKFAISLAMIVISNYVTKKCFEDEYQGNSSFKKFCLWYTVSFKMEFRDKIKISAEQKERFIKKIVDSDVSYDTIVKDITKELCDIVKKTKG